MFAPKVAKPQTKATESPTNNLTHQRATPINYGTAKWSRYRQAHFLESTIGNQATLRLLAQRAWSPADDQLDDALAQGTERTHDRTAGPGLSWDFSNVFPPDQVNQTQASPLSAPRLPGIIQPKLVVGAVNDPLEHEADGVAGQVIRMANPEFSIVASPTQLSRKCTASNDGERQTKPTGAPIIAGSEAPGVVHEVLRTPGQPLDAATQAYFEPRFGYDFSRVRVHTDAVAAESAEAVNAVAYTVGSHLVFARQKYAPHSRQGQELLAHELTHVVQQGATPLRSRETRTAEAEATHFHGNPARPYPASGTQAPTIARQQQPGEKAAEVQDEESTKDKWKGTPVSTIVISLARSRVGFRIPQGMLLGTVDTDLAAGTYQLTPVLDQQNWNIDGPGVKPGLRFFVDLSESNADPWTLSYPDKLPLIVSVGMSAEPKTFGQAIDPNTSAMKDPLWAYEGWGNTGPLQPVTGIDDYETIGLDRQSVTPTAGKPKPTSPLYRVKYRDKSERTLSYAELTPKMRAQLQPIFQKADDEFVLFTLQTFPMWWSVVSITPLAPMPETGARPYIPKRVPLAPEEGAPGTRARPEEMAPPEMAPPEATTPSAGTASVAAYIDWNPGATDAERSLGNWLDQQAQVGNLPGVSRVRGMPEAPPSKLGGVSSGQRSDYHLIPPGSDPNAITGSEGRADAVIAKSGNIDSIVKNALSKIGGQADVPVIEIGEGASAAIKDADVLAWREDIFNTSQRIQRLIVIRNTGGTRQIVLDAKRP